MSGPLSRPQTTSATMAPTKSDRSLDLRLNQHLSHFRTLLVSVLHLMLAFLDLEVTVLNFAQKVLIYREVSHMLTSTMFICSYALNTSRHSRGALHQCMPAPCTHGALH